MTTPSVPSAMDHLNKAIESLEAALVKNPDFIAWKALIEARAAISGAGSTTITALTALSGGMQVGDTIEMTAADTLSLRRKRVSQADAAEMALREAGTPLTTRALIPGVEKHGQVVGGDDPVLNLSSIMSKDPRFESIQWNGERAWWFKGRPLPGAKPLQGVPMAGGPMGSS